MPQAITTAVNLVDVDSVIIGSQHFEQAREWLLSTVQETLTTRTFRRGGRAVCRVIDELISQYPDLSECRRDIESARALLVRQFKAGKKLLIAGNGGSSADAEHIVGELMKGCTLSRPIIGGLRERLINMGAQEVAERLQGALPAIALGSQTALTSAILNDIDGHMISYILR